MKQEEEQKKNEAEPSLRRLHPEFIEKCGFLMFYRSDIKRRRLLFSLIPIAAHVIWPKLLK
jgi:hypothetical protein